MASDPSGTPSSKGTPPVTGFGTTADAVNASLSAITLPHTAASSALNGPQQAGARADGAGGDSNAWGPSEGDDNAQGLDAQWCSHDMSLLEADLRVPGGPSGGPFGELPMGQESAKGAITRAARLTTDPIGDTSLPTVPYGIAGSTSGDGYSVGAGVPEMDTRASSKSSQGSAPGTRGIPPTQTS